MSKERRKSEPDAIQSWAARVNWPRRVNAVCKPCWELKYCPYGPLVEGLPLPDERTARSCRIFGHDCPVFYVAEPLTETKELRNISRSIPRPIQFRVLKRENSVCRRCHQPVPDEHMHFDHVIPWSKGGPTEESNIQLVCKDCNLKKRSKYEDEFLVNGIHDHLVQPVNCKILDTLLFLVRFRHHYSARQGHCPDAEALAGELNNGEKTEAEEKAAEILWNIEDYFRREPPDDITSTVQSALRLRWGYTDGVTRTLRAAAKESGARAEELRVAEVRLIERLGWVVRESETERKSWLST